MNAPSILFATVFFLSAGGECKGEAKLMETKPVLEIELAPQKVKQGQDISMALRLKNTSSKNLWVNQRMLFNNIHSPPMMRELWVDLVGPDGAQVPFSSHIRTGEAGASNFGVLKPGQDLSKQIKLSKYFELKKPGVYRITAYYQDGTEDIPKAPAGAPHLREPIRSAPASFELLAP